MLDKKPQLKKVVTSKIIRGLGELDLVKPEDYSERIYQFAQKPTEIQEAAELIYDDFKLTAEDAENFDLEQLHNDIRVMLGKFFTPKQASTN